MHYSEAPSLKTNDIDRCVGETVRANRAIIGKSLEDLASSIDVDVQVLTLMEAGERRISAAQLLAIAKALGIKPGKIFADCETSSTNVLGTEHSLAG